MIYKQLHPTNDFRNIDQLIKNSNLNLEELKRIDKEQPRGSILYRYYVQPYADGKIHWQIIKVLKKTCIVQACEGINLDEWVKGQYSIKKGYAEQMIEWRLETEKLNKK